MQHLGYFDAKPQSCRNSATTAQQSVPVDGGDNAVSLFTATTATGGNDGQAWKSSSLCKNRDSVSQQPPNYSQSQSTIPPIITYSAQQHHRPTKFKSD